MKISVLEENVSESANTILQVIRGVIQTPSNNDAPTTPNRQQIVSGVLLLSPFCIRNRTIHTMTVFLPKGHFFSPNTKR